MMNLNPTYIQIERKPPTAVTRIGWCIPTFYSIEDKAK